MTDEDKQSDYDRIEIRISIGDNYMVDDIVSHSSHITPELLEMSPDGIIEDYVERASREVLLSYKDQYKRGKLNE